MIGDKKCRLKLFKMLKYKVIPLEHKSKIINEKYQDIGIDKLIILFNLEKNPAIKKIIALFLFKLFKLNTNINYQDEIIISLQEAIKWQLPY